MKLLGSSLITAPAATKETVATTAGLAALGLTPQDISMTIAIIVGLFSGMAASWSLRKQTHDEIPKGWFLFQMASWGLITVVVLALADWFHMSMRVVMAVVCIAAFLSQRGLVAVQDKIIEKIKNYEPPK